jgi:hypothetical protein
MAIAVDDVWKCRNLLDNSDPVPRGVAAIRASLYAAAGEEQGAPDGFGTESGSVIPSHSRTAPV